MQHLIGDVEGAEQELGESGDYLRAASLAASEPLKARIKAVEEEVSALGSLAANPDAKARSRYDKALADLRQLVQER